MMFKSAEELCDALVKSKALHCSRCDRLLQPPVMTVEGHGTICQECYKDADGGTPNTALDSVLEQLDFACEYEDCSSRVKVADYTMHVEYCSYRSIKCEIDGCIWEGPRKAYLDHVIKQHEIDTVSGNSFKIAHIEENTLRTYIVKSLCGSLVVNIFLTADSYFFLTSEIGIVPKQSSFKALIRCSQGSTTYTVDCKVLKSNNFIAQFPHDDGVEVKKEALKVLFPTEAPLIQWEVDVGNTLAVLNDLTIIKNCYICGGSLESNTYKCESRKNRNICIPCVLKIRKCPCELMCSDGACSTCCPPKSESLSLEEEEHISTCRFYVWQCPFCNDFIDYVDLKEHLEAKHTGSYHNSSHVNISKHVCANRRKACYIRSFGRIFKIFQECIDYSNTDSHYCEWFVNHIGPHEISFKFEVEVYADKCPGESLLLRGDCNYNANQFDKKCRVKNIMLCDLLKDTSQYCFSVRISPKQD